MALSLRLPKSRIRESLFLINYQISAAVVFLEIARILMQLGMRWNLLKPPAKFMESPVRFRRESAFGGATTLHDMN